MWLWTDDSHWAKSESGERKAILLTKVFCALVFAFIFAWCEWTLRIRQMWTSVHFPFNNHFLFLLSVHFCLKNCRYSCRQKAAGRFRETCSRDVTFRIITQASLPIIVHLLTLSLISHTWLWSWSDRWMFALHFFLQLWSCFSCWTILQKFLLCPASLFVCVFKKKTNEKTF